MMLTEIAKPTDRLLDDDYEVLTLLPRYPRTARLESIAKDVDKLPAEVTEILKRLQVKGYRIVRENGLVYVNPSGWNLVNSTASAWEASR